MGTDEKRKLVEISRLVKDMITVPTDSLAAEQAGESAAFGHHLLGNVHIVFGLGLANGEFTNLLKDCMRKLSIRCGKDVVD